MKVLIIDDDPMVLRIATARLKNEGLDITCADGGHSGLGEARRSRPDVILLDVDMPDLSGFEVIHELQSDGDLCRTPVIFVTGSCNVADKVHGLDLGAVDYVTKPFDPFELRARVNAALRTKRLHDLLTTHSQIDPLTELWNRRALTERLEEEWERVRRYGCPLAFVMADLDYFKQLNDTFGHRMGDKVLAEVARVLREIGRNVDLPCRYGGEEFAILVPEQTADGAAALAERCRRAVAEIRVPAGDKTAAPTASFGVSDSEGATGPDELIEHADAALYQAKQNGRNCVVTHAAVPADLPADPPPVDLDPSTLAGEERGDDDRRMVS
jgi:diguanylate cyclase (GGDEF)-like protein